MPERADTPEAIGLNRARPHSTRPDLGLGRRRLQKGRVRSSALIFEGKDEELAPAFGVVTSDKSASELDSPNASRCCDAHFPVRHRIEDRTHKAGNMPRSGLLAFHAEYKISGLTNYPPSRVPRLETRESGQPSRQKH
jgi:hypothetical protein